MLANFWRLIKNLKFLQLALYIIFAFFFLPSFGDRWLLELASGFLLLNVLLVSLSTVGAVRWRWLFWLLFAAAAVCHGIYLTQIGPGGRLLFIRLTIICNMLLLLLCIGGILSYIFQTIKVTLDTLFAAVVAYLIIACTFTHAYLLLCTFNPQSLSIPLPLRMDSFNIFESNIIYYSLIVITTVGMGDILPLTPMARILTVVEAVVGQFFVAILMAWLVGRFIAQAISAEKLESQD